MKILSNISDVVNSDFALPQNIQFIPCIDAIFELPGHPGPNRVRLPLCSCCGGVEIEVIDGCEHIPAEKLESLADAIIEQWKREGGK